jgi:hypothetical protein
VEELLSGGVLEQVQAHLSDVEAEAREQWSDDDAAIMLHMMETWKAATRKGYTLDDLQAILRKLDPAAE